MTYFTGLRTMPSDNSMREVCAVKRACLDGARLSANLATVAHELPGEAFEQLNH